MANRFFRAYVSVSPAPGEPRVETLLPSLLRLNVMPVWPEPKADWDARKALIDSCDYMIVFCGHTYMPRPPAGASWQHREFNYGSVRQIPLFSALLDPVSFKEKVDPSSLARLEAFRSQVATVSSLFWDERKNIPELLEKAWPAFVLRHPAAGWVRARGGEPQPVRIVRQEKKKPQVQVDDSLNDLSEDVEPQALEDIDIDWLEGEERLTYGCKIYIKGNCHQITLDGVLLWGEICQAFLRPMTPSSNKDKIERSLADLLEKRFTDTALSSLDQAHAVTDFAFSETSMRKIRLKLRRSGFIRKDTKASGRHHQVWVATAAGQAAVRNRKESVTV